MSPGPNDTPIERSPGIPLSYQSSRHTKRTPTQETPPRSPEAKVVQPPAAELQPWALPRLLHCRESRALHPASPKTPGVPLPAGPSHRPQLQASPASRVRCPAEGNAGGDEELGRSSRVAGRAFLGGLPAGWGAGVLKPSQAQGKQVVGAREACGVELRTAPLLKVGSSCSLVSQLHFSALILNPGGDSLI